MASLSAMCALANLPARAAPRFRAAEASAPALAADVTTPVRLSALFKPAVADLFPLFTPPELVLAALEGASFSLRDARRLYTDTCLRWLVSIVRRLVWRDLLKLSKAYGSADNAVKTEFARGPTCACALPSALLPVLCGRRGRPRDGCARSRTKVSVISASALVSGLMLVLLSTATPAAPCLS